MKLIIAGSRNFDSGSICELIQWYIQVSGVDLSPTLIVSGKAEGVDHAGEIYAEICCLPVKEFAADWDKHGRAAGPIRNKQMAEYADALLLIWNGESPGSKSMKSEMTKLNKPIYEIILK